MLFWPYKLYFNSLRDYTHKTVQIVHAATKQLPRVVIINVLQIVFYHSVVSAGWYLRINAFPPGQVLRNIAERKQWVL